MKRTRRRRVAIWVGGALAVLLVMVAVFATMSAVAGDHTIRSVTYDQSPPTSGDHSPVWQRCGFYSNPVGDEHAVHSLEHGVVWIAYQPGLPADQISLLREFTAGQEHLIVSPYPELPAPIVVSTWGHQQALDRLDIAALDSLVLEMRNSSQAPEPGGSCEGPNLWFSGGTGDPES